MRIGIIGVPYRLAGDGEALGVASRENAVQCNGSLITMLGVQWTTRVALARKVSRIIH